MDRLTWLKEKRREAEERYDILWAPQYGTQWGIYDNATHQTFVRKFLALLPQPCTILDAACGAGRYFPLLIKDGRTVFGIDQSLGMLRRARAEFPKIRLDKVGLQEIQNQQSFDGILCVDAMEHIGPEDWLLVLSNFHRALKMHGVLYFTVEFSHQKVLQNAFVNGQELGQPIVFGELPDEDVYHYYPTLRRVKKWVKQAGFELIDIGKGNGYRHFLVRKGSA
jgi:cyclopropane fatty-acyl-phospholipid synthase-like methyltransferase